MLSILRKRIDESSTHRLSFAEYMETVLYHPEKGYYSKSIQSAINTFTIAIRNAVLTIPNSGRNQ